MKLIVIGASGFIGSHIFAMAREKGYETIGTQCSSNNGGLVRFDMLSQRITDVLPQGFFDTGSPVYAIICSALCKLDKCYYNRDMSYALNVTKTIDLIEDLKKAGIKFVFISTEFVFDGLLGYYDETSPVSPVNEYGRQKVEVENHILSHTSDDLIFRLSKVVGDDPGDEHFFSDLYKKVLQNSAIQCIQGQMFSPTYVKDIANGIFTALELKLIGLYHLANPEYFLRDELARQFLISINKNVDVIAKPLEEFGFPEKRSMKTCLDGTKFRKATGMHFTPIREVMNAFADKIK